MRVNLNSAPNIHPLNLNYLAVGMSGTSSEPWTSSAYSEDLRWKTVWQKYALGLTCDSIAANLCVDKSTVSRTIELFHTTGSVSKIPYRELTSPAQLFILTLVLEQPGMYLHEMQRELKENMMLEISTSTLCQFLHRIGFSRQRMRAVAVQDKVLREQYILDVSMYAPKMLVLIDETGADHWNIMRKHGYSVRGKPPVNNTLLFKGERVSAIVCLSVEGILDVRMVKGTSIGDEFYDFVNINLIPHLPFDGINQHSFVVWDNCQFTTAQK